MIKECWCALALAILSPSFIMPEMSFEYLAEGVCNTNFNRPTSVNDDDVRDMIKMRESMTYGAIGKLYGVSAGAVHKRIKRYKNQLHGPSNGGDTHEK